MQDSYHQRIKRRRSKKNLKNKRNDIFSQRSSESDIITNPYHQNNNHHQYSRSMAPSSVLHLFFICNSP